MNKIIKPTIHRRRIVQAGAAGTIGLAFGALAARDAQARGRRHHHGRPRSADYGPLSPKTDESTGLALLSLPDGFRYISYGWTGQIMADGRPTPTDPDGMAVVARRGSLISMVRNHELGTGEGPQAYVERAMYNPAEYGGTTNLFFNVRTGKWITSYTSLGGTIRNCAGGLTPWDSWITCEETFHEWNSRDDGFNHGYIFDVPGFGVGTGVPIRAAGRFSHEAVAVDPGTGIVYETEDSGSSALYKYVPPGAGHHRFGRRRRGPLRDGGELYAMVVDGVSRNDLTGGFDDGARFSVSWEPVSDPEGMQGRAFDSAPNAAVISRGEGAWYDNGKIYFVSTNGGAASLGQVWVYDPRREELIMLYESRDSEDVHAPDNIAVSPRSGLLLCEDGPRDPQRLIGLTQRGETFDFAHNNIVLGPGDVDAIDAVFPGTRDNFWDEPEGSYTDVEWAGATFYDDWLFVNIQSPGVTFAITGPWHRGAL
jgi:secreted PhoX family phosphatase